MRTRCATGLRYSPKNGCQRSKHPGPRVPPWRLAALGGRRGTGCPGLVADSPYGGVCVLVVELVADPVGDVDDVGLVLGRRGRLAGGLAGALPVGPRLLG